VQCPGPGASVVDLERHEIPAGNLVDLIVTFTTGISSTLQRRSARMESRMPTMEMPRATNAIMSEVLNDCLLLSTPGIPGVLKTTAFHSEQPVGSPPGAAGAAAQSAPASRHVSAHSPCRPPFPCRGSRCRIVHPRLFRHRFHFIRRMPLSRAGCSRSWRGFATWPLQRRRSRFVRRRLSAGRGQSRGGYGAPRRRHPCDRHGDRMRSRHACRWRRLVPFDQRCAPQRVRVPDRGRRRPAVHPFPGIPA
jgi:hypothetical protein